MTKLRPLFRLLKQQWSGDEEVIESLVRFEEKPGRYKTVLEDIQQE